MAAAADFVDRKDLYIGGEWKSGIGRELGSEGLAAYTEYQSIILPAKPA